MWASHWRCVPTCLTRRARWLEYETWLLSFWSKFDTQILYSFGSDFDVFCCSLISASNFLWSSFFRHSLILSNFKQCCHLFCPNRRIVGGRHWNAWKLKPKTVPWCHLNLYPSMTLIQETRQSRLCLREVMLSPIVFGEMIQLDEWHTFQLKWGGREIASKWCLREALNFFCTPSNVNLGELMSSYWHFLFSRVLNLCFQLCWWLMLVAEISLNERDFYWRCAQHMISTNQAARHLIFKAPTCAFAALNHPWFCRRCNPPCYPATLIRRWGMDWMNDGENPLGVSGKGSPVLFLYHKQSIFSICKSAPTNSHGPPNHGLEFGHFLSNQTYPV